MKYLTPCLAATLALVIGSCTTPAGTTQTGSVHLAVLWPQSGFQIQSIPKETSQIEVRISGEGLSATRTESLKRSEGAQSLTLSLPVGKKRVQVSARSAGGDILAESVQDSVLIQANATTRLDMDLKEVELQATPTPASGGAGGPNGTGSDEPGPSPGGGEGPDSSSGPGQPSASDNPQPPEPQPSSAPTAVPSPAPSRSSNGSSGSGNNSSQPDLGIISLVANPNPVSGPSYPTELTANVRDVNHVLLDETYSWSCLDAAFQTQALGQPIPCDNFVPEAADPRKAIWIAPDTGGQFILKLTIQSGDITLSRSVQVTVQSGNGNLELDNGGFEGGEVEESEEGGQGEN